jgi:voltage-gated potassium channel
MQKAGANSVVSPNKIGGMRLASEMLRPHVVSFLDLMLKEHTRTLRIEEIVIKSASPWVDKPLGDLNLRLRYNLLPMALKNASGTAESAQNFWVNPPDNIRMKPGVVVIVMGDVHDIQKAREDSLKTHTFVAMKV